MPTIDFKNIGDVLNFELLRGTIVTLDSATDTCTVNVGGGVLTALLFYHCSTTSAMRDNGAIEGAAAGFSVGDEVIVLKRHDNTSIKVIGHTDGIRTCFDSYPRYYIFYDDGTPKIANCTYGNDGVKINATKTFAEIEIANPYAAPITFHCKRFTHNVPVNGVSVARDLYFVATSLYINPNLYPGWVGFCDSNLDCPLVTNNGNTKITVTDQVLADLNSVNAYVNDNHTYLGDDNSDDNWQIMQPGGSGDCEDFALTKAQKLLDMGYPAAAIHIEGGYVDTETPGHAWLVVQTTGGDYALDRSSNSIILNSALKASAGKDYHSRRRQIGRNWAFISPFGWLSGTGNQSLGNYVWYILDPLLNIFYLLPPLKARDMPFLKVSDLSDGSEISTPSINFSADNNSIYLAEDGTISKYKLNENSLDLVSTAPYTGCGFVGRDGAIVEPEDVYGRQDPLNWEGGAVNVFQRNDIWHLSSIAAARIGAFKALSDCRVISKNGYYEYEYVYLTGEFSDEAINHSYEGDAHSWDQVLTIHYENAKKSMVEHRKTIISYYEDNETLPAITNAVSDESIYIREQFFATALPKSDGEMVRFNSECIHPLVLNYPISVPFDSDDYEASISTPFGESFDYYDEPYETYGPYYPHQWSHVDTDAMLLQSFILKRAQSAGDDVPRIYKNGASVLADVISAVGTTEDSLLGFIYVPGADRLSE